MIRFIVVGLVLTLTLLAVAALLLDRRSTEVEASLSLAEAIGGGIAEEEALAGTPYARAVDQREFSFPQDHGPHDNYKLEWWYFTGNLVASDGSHFGYQLTFFRTALSPTKTTAAVSDSSSKWATNQLYTAHFAVTDVSEKRFVAEEKVTRGSVGLAGAFADPFRVWVEEWSATQVGDATFPISLHAAIDGVQIDLVLETEKPVVLQGEQGLSAKGTGVGQASYYYSFTRLKTTGAVTVGGDRVEVTGSSWLDREWSTSLLGRTQVGWDWFSIQLDDQSEIMHFRLRENEAGAAEFRDAVIIDADGTKRDLDTQALVLDELETWRNKKGDAEYPAKWRLRIPDEKIDLELEPFLSDQELNLTIRYWEGAIRATGTRNGLPISGTGYAELTGYANSAPN